MNELSRMHLHALRSPRTLRAFTLRRCSLQGFERDEVSRGGRSPHKKHCPLALSMACMDEDSVCKESIHYMRHNSDALNLLKQAA